jgi:hypothetical protein
LTIKAINTMIDERFADAADKFADNEHRRGTWEVWAWYDIRSQENGGRYVLAVDPDESELPPRVDLERALKKTGGVVHAGSHEEQLVRRAIERTRLRKEGWMYYPLVKKPDLFLKFARLADGGGLDKSATVAGLDTDKNTGVALDWAGKYGVLGLTRGDEKEWFRGASTRGGKADTVASFASEAWRANDCLRLYEAATAEELGKDFIASYMHPRNRGFFTQTPARTREWALNLVATETQQKVAGNAYPALYGEVGKFISGYSFSNLLGAMWLQMFWLLTASEEPRRCRNWECDKIIAYKLANQPMQGLRKNDRSGGYATRKDRKFCDDKCRNRYNYLTRTIPRRHAAREL